HSTAWPGSAGPPYFPRSWGWQPPGTPTWCAEWERQWPKRSWHPTSRTQPVRAVTYGPRSSIRCETPDGDVTKKAGPRTPGSPVCSPAHTHAAWQGTVRPCDWPPPSNTSSVTTTRRTAAPPPATYHRGSCTSTSCPPTCPPCVTARRWVSCPPTTWSTADPPT